MRELGTGKLYPRPGTGTAAHVERTRKGVVWSECQKLGKLLEQKTFIELQ